MRELFSFKNLLLLMVFSLLLGAVFLIISATRSQTDTRLTTIVETGPVRQIVAVSGILQAENELALGFLSPGNLERLLVRKGDTVVAGQLLAEQNLASLKADLADAMAVLERARADRRELVDGPTSERLAVVAAGVALRAEALAQTEITEQQRVDNARRTLLSSSLTAYSNQADEPAGAPLVSGTYHCDREGKYKIDVFRSNALSGYSLELSGLESGVFPVSTGQAIPVGSCGLRLLFAQDSAYGDTTWYIDIPNQKSTSYTTNKNNYELALSQANSAIKLAKQELALAQAEAVASNAPARSEAVTRASSVIEQAEARLAKLTAEVSQRQLYAPSAGTITNTSALPGETVGSEPIISLFANQSFELTAKIPESAIAQIKVGQKAEVIFDANRSTPLLAEVDYIAPGSQTISGVAFFEIRLRLTEKPDWLRSGLNADINIITEESLSKLRLPQRFITEQDGTYTVLLKTGQTVATTTIEVIQIGNDGFVSFRGLTLGDTVVAQ